MTHNTQWFTQACKPIDIIAQQAAKDHQANLTKPQGSLGELESLRCVLPVGIRQ